MRARSFAEESYYAYRPFSSRSGRIPAEFLRTCLSSVILIRVRSGKGNEMSASLAAGSARLGPRLSTAWVTVAVVLLGISAFAGVVSVGSQSSLQRMSATGLIPNKLAPTAFGTPAEPNARTLPGASPKLPQVHPAGSAWIQLDGDPLDLVFNPPNGFVYVDTESITGNVTVLNGTSISATFTLNGSPYGFVPDSANGYIYATNGGGLSNASNVTVLNGTKVVGSFYVANATQGGVYDPQDGFLYFLDYDSANVSVVSGTSVIATIPVGSHPIGAAFDPNNDYVYVASFDSGNISILKGTTVVGLVRYNGTGAEGPVFDPANGDVYVAYYGETNVTSGTWAERTLVINGESVIGSVTIGSGGGGVVSSAYDSINQFVYFPNYANNSITAVNGTEVVGSVGVGRDPNAVAFDPRNGGLYVGNFQSGNITVVFDSFAYVNITATPSTVLVGTGTTFDVKVKGVGPWNYSYAGLPTGCTSVNAPNLACTPTETGSFTIRVYANDTAGYSLTNTTTLTVVPPLSVSASASSNRTDAGVILNFFSSPNGGLGTESFAWEFGDGSSSSIQSPSHAYSAQGDFTSRVWVNDSEGGSATNAVSVIVDPALAVGLGISNATPALGQSVAITASPSGGAGPYAFAYSGLPPGCVSVNSSRIGCLPTQAGFYNLSVLVTDHNGISATASIELDVVFDFTVIAPSQDLVNHAFTISVKPEGGYGTLTYSYTGLPPGCASLDAPELSCTPSQVGAYNISISVQDQAGNQATQLIKVDVVNAGPSTYFSFLTSPLGLGLLGAAALVLLALAVLAYSRRTVRRPSLPDQYSAYRVPPPTVRPAGSGPQGPPPDDGATPSTDVTDQDSLTDMV